MHLFFPVVGSTIFFNIKKGQMAEPFYIWQTVSKGQTWLIGLLKRPKGNPEKNCFCCCDVRPNFDRSKCLLTKNVKKERSTNSFVNIARKMSKYEEHPF